MTTREKLIQTATALFAARGYNATGMADILAAAGVHRGSLYHAFPAKKDLLLAVLEHYRSGISERLVAPAWAGVDDPIERVFALLARYRRFLTDTGGRFGCPIGSLALELHEADAEVRASITPPSMTVRVKSASRRRSRSAGRRSPASTKHCST